MKMDFEGDMTLMFDHDIKIVQFRVTNLNH